MRSILDESSIVLVQGITGNEGRFHTEAMLKYGTRVAAGVTPGKGGQQVYGVPVYNTVAEAVKSHGVNTSMVLVPAKDAPAAVNESIDAGLRVIVVITESIPLRDSIEFIAKAQAHGTLIVGPNTPGTIAPPKKVKVGIMPSHVFSPGVAGIASRSGTLVYEIAWHITEAKLGQSLCTGIGGDPVTGMDFVMTLEMFRQDESTRGVVLVGEVGGKGEELAAQYIVDTKYTKPVVAYIAGRSAPPEKRMGHAGAIVVGNVGTAKSKVEAFTAAGVSVADKPSDIPRLLKARL